MPPKNPRRLRSNSDDHPPKPAKKPRCGPIAGLLKLPPGSKKKNTTNTTKKKAKPKEKAPTVVAEVPNKVLIESTTNEAVNVEVEFIKAKVIEPKLHKVKFCIEVYYDTTIIGK